MKIRELLNGFLDQALTIMHPMLQQALLLKLLKHLSINLTGGKFYRNQCGNVPALSY